MTTTTQARPTARQIVRDDAIRHGWVTIDSTDQVDVFARGGDTVLMAWTAQDTQRLAVGASLLPGSDPAVRDNSNLCIIRCREWLARMPSEAASF